ncbi:MAG: penicillin-binding protein activator [Gammaproteobacteria bacterium]|nr:penicillin-binding protein activator [Gammaproteobacteria bacterium]
MNLHTLKLFLLFTLLAIVSACDTQPVKQEQETAETTMPTSEKQTTLSEETQRLLELAEDSDTEAEKFKYRALAAHLFVQAGEISLAQQQLNFLKDKQQNHPAIDSASAAIETATVLLLSTEIAIAEENTELADELINTTKPVTREQQIQYYELKANLDYLSGRYMYVVDRRVQLDAYMTDSKSKNENNRKIWAALSSMTTMQLNSQHSSNATIQGWLELTKITRSGQSNISKLEDDLLDWATHHSSHPANESFLNYLFSIYQGNVSERKHIAVILPFKGELENVSYNIKNGILSAYYDSNSGSNTILMPTLHFYDSSNTTLSFSQLYQQAIEDGATNIIGPLDKVAINQLAQQQELDIPVLTLNYSESTFNNTENLFQFGLSPEDEAHQVAELAIQQKKMRAAVFYPDSEWGKRLYKAFSDHYISLGGKIINVGDYATDTNDYRHPIRTLLNLDQSDIRRKKVENTISQKVQYEPYRRQDIDMIFLAATHRSARGIMPSFKFHHAGDIPVYSTSHIYTGKIDREQDRDLNGLTFCDLPWVLHNTSPLDKVFKQNWPQQENFTRLFALGVDAYHLIYNLDYLQNKDFAFYEGQTGNIQLDEHNRITRNLLWAKFERGVPVYLEPEINEQTGNNSTAPSQVKQAL